jgi:hypothetical protein
MDGCGCGPAQALAVLPDMSQSRPRAFTEDLALEASEDGQRVWLDQAPRSEIRTPRRDPLP